MLEDIKSWNIMLPFDLRWRRKYKIAFGSPAHRSISPIDQMFDIKEEQYFKDLMKSKEETIEDINNFDQDELDKEFENLVI